MKLLLFCLSQAAFGETFIGLSLAAQLRRDGWESHFVIPPVTRSAVQHFGFPHTVVDYTDAPKGPAARSFMDELIEQQHPDAIVLCDFTVFHRNVRFHYQLEPDFIREYGLPVLPLDLTECETSDFEVDLAGAEPLSLDRGILDYPVHVRPVPPGHLTAPGSSRALPYRVVEAEHIAEDVCQRTRADLGLSDDDRLVLLPMSSWQRPPGGRGLWSEMMSTLSDHVPDLLVHYLLQLPPTTHFVIIGHAPDAFDRLPAERAHGLPPIAIDRYTELLAAADLLVLLSPPSVTGVRAVLMDKAVVVIQNRFAVHSAQDLAAVESELGGVSTTVRDWLTETGPIDRFRMWPKGCFQSQERMFTDNDYTTALVTTELLDERGTVTALRDLLRDSEASRGLAKARVRYRDQVDALPATADVLREAVRRG